MTKDLRDPKALGQVLLFERGQWPAVALSVIADDPPHVVDYDANPSCIEKYGDPRLLPSTLPN